MIVRKDVAMIADEETSHRSHRTFLAPFAECLTVRCESLVPQRKIGGYLSSERRAHLEFDARYSCRVEMKTCDEGGPRPQMGNSDLSLNSPMTR
jgi:hypothetical protein